MSLGLTNAPASFQHFINDILSSFVNRFVTAYLDDILIYSENLEEHRGHVKSVLEALPSAGQHLKAERCEFYKQEVRYLELIVARDGVNIDLYNVAAVKDWDPPECIFNV